MLFRICCVCCLLLLAAPSGFAAQDLLLRGATVVDVQGASARTADVLVQDGLIAAVGAPGSLSSDEREVFDLSGLYLLPGFIDAHVHFSNFEAAKRALHSGVTTARSMGTSNYADVGLRELIASGAIEGPELFAAGYHVRPALAESFFIDVPELGDLIGGVSGALAFRRVAGANLSRKVDFIKVVATDRAGLPETDPRRQIMSEEEVYGIVHAAVAKSVPVAAHAHGDGGARAAVLAGVRSIEHGTYLSEETLRLMSQKGTFLVPTLAIVTDLIEPGGDYDSPVLKVRGRHMYPRLCKTVRQARELDVGIVASTDTGYGPNSVIRIQHDIEALRNCGLTPAEAILAATMRGAELLGIEARTGKIAPGMEADLIAVSDDPLADLVALQDVLVVISDGRIALDRVRMRPSR